MKPRDLPAFILDSGAASAEAGASAPRRCRTIWLSDIHLGTAGCKAEYLLDFLRHHDCETLYLAFVGDSLYTFTLVLNHWFNRLRSRLGLCYWSLSQYLKHRVKNAVSFISDFEQALADEARRRGFDGVVCGHIHKPEIRDIGGVLYCNDGDWVESLTALVETPDGALELVHWAMPAARAGMAVERPLPATAP